MALSNLKEAELQYLDIWFSNLVDAVNYDLGKIEDAVPALSKILTNIDTAPVKYLKDSLDNIVRSINESFKEIEDRLKALEAKGS